MNLIILCVLFIWAITLWIASMMSNTSGLFVVALYGAVVGIGLSGIILEVIKVAK